jgi:hypothetical protein
MSKKVMLLAIAAVAALAFAAMPALASANTPEVDPSSGTFPLAFTGTSGVGTLNSSVATVTCKKDKNTGTFTNRTSGTLEVTCEECTGPLGVACTTSGQASGVITTNTSVFDLVYLKAGGTTPGVVDTPPTGGTFAEFSCSALAKLKVTGNGLLGHVDSPACGATSSAFAVDFEATGTAQKYTQVEEAGTVFSLLTSLLPGTPVTSSEVSVGNETYSGGRTAQLTCP